MRRSDPPRGATWLITRLGCGPTVESLLGDLIEEFGGGRSRLWYWRQAIAAIVIGFGQEIRAHSVLAARAVLTGSSVLVLFGWLVADPLFEQASRVAVARGLISIGTMNQYEALGWMAIGSLGFAGSGWMVSRLHRPNHRPMVLLFASFTTVLQLPRLCELIVDALGHPRYLPYLSGHVAGMLIILCSTLGGGLGFRASGRRSTGPVSARS